MFFSFNVTDRELRAKLEKLVSYLCLIIAVCLLFAALADADPLGVNQNVTFDEVGGLEDRTSC